MKKLTAVVVSILLCLPPATAMGLPPSDFDPIRDVPPAPVGTPKPGVPMKQKTRCSTSAVLPDSQFTNIPISGVFHVNDLHRYSTGTGQRVAVIDSGVAPNIRLPKLVGGGDFIMGGNGLSDCDHHGTLIAGIIAAKPARNDGFIGVAPDATIISIRQTSSAFEPEKTDESSRKGGSTLGSLSQAIRRAADLKATVINMSVTACIPSNLDLDLRELKGALYYAAVKKDIVIVSSAGNIDQTCKANPGPSPDNPGDEKGWSRVETVSLPSYIDQFVLSVGGTTLTGDPYINSLPGPWVDVAAPAINVVSLDPVAGETGGLINAEITQKGTVPLSGTSFAAAYISGLAALIRQHHPSLSANQVRNRIINSSHPVASELNNILGRGIVDPLQAISGDIPSGDYLPQNIPSTEGGDVYREPERSDLPKYIALVVVACGALVLVLMISKNWVSRKEASDV